MVVLYKFPKNIWKKMIKSKAEDELLKANKFMYGDTVIIKKRVPFHLHPGEIVSQNLIISNHIFAFGFL